MAVYVGTIKYPFGRMIMFHMASPDVEELHQMADKIGIARKWFQDNKNHVNPHYDVCKSKKMLAIRYGAIEVNDRELIKICFPKLRDMMNKPSPDKPKQP